MTLGFMGRMTGDKGYPQALEVFASCRRHWPGRYQMLSVGEMPDLDHHETQLCQHLGTDRSGYHSLGPVTRNEVWQVYDQMDVLLFPSTSNLETFGRVLVEASYAGVPVLAAGHGAAHELIDPVARVPVTYRRGELIRLRDSVAMGDLDLDAAVGALAEPAAIPRSNGHELYAEDDELFLHLVKEGISAARMDRVVRSEQAAFTALVKLQDLPSLTEQQAQEQIGELVKMILALHDWYSLRYYKALSRLILASPTRRRTAQFVGRSVRWGEDLTNIGGMDMEFAHFLLFAPGYRLEGESNA
ncbi:MAG: glycosyltransferase [Pseudonocardiaceae bacterium]